MAGEEYAMTMPSSKQPTDIPDTAASCLAPPPPELGLSTRTLPAWGGDGCFLLSSWRADGLQTQARSP